MRTYVNTDSLLDMRHLKQADSETRQDKQNAGVSPVGNSNSLLFFYDPQLLKPVQPYQHSTAITP